MPRTPQNRKEHTQRHSELTGGGGLAPSVADPEPWDLVPYTYRHRQVSKSTQLVNRAGANSSKLRTRNLATDGRLSTLVARVEERAAANRLDLNRDEKRMVK